MNRPRFPRGLPAYEQALNQGDTTPTHIGRVRTYLDLPGKLALTVNGTLAGEAAGVQPFDYLAQKSSSVDEPTATVLDPPSSDLRLDLVLEKELGHGAALQLWGRDVLNDEFVEAFWDINYLGYPRTTGRTFGAALRYRP